MNINNTPSNHISSTIDVSKNSTESTQGPGNAATKLAGSLNELNIDNVDNAGLTKKLKEFLSDLGTTPENNLSG
jgi:hypothetical protein